VPIVVNYSATSRNHKFVRTNCSRNSLLLWPLPRLLWLLVLGLVLFGIALFGSEEADSTRVGNLGAHKVTVQKGVTPRDCCIQTRLAAWP